MSLSSQISETYAITIQWDPSFTTQNSIEMYRASVSPDPSSCSHTQLSSENYSCSGLIPDTAYNFAISGGCQDIDGTERTLSITLPAGIGYNNARLPVFISVPLCT